MTDIKRSRPAAAAPPPARSTKHADVPVPPRKREHSARVARSSRIPYGERDSEDVAPAPPPPKRLHFIPAYVDRELDQLAPPTATRVDAPVQSKRKPSTASHKQTREELKHASKNKPPKQPEPWEASSCARTGLEHYNSMHQGDEHELVKAVGVHSFIWSGGWLHANFLARRKGANSSIGLVPKYFFAELKLDGFGLSCTSCSKMDSVEANNLGGCEVCPRNIIHPAAGDYHAGKEPAATDGQTAAADDQPASDDDLEITFDF